ncbi:hypothetical protein KGM_215924 [Danaus plexippus plexippus]|uniref:Uncharacterized protein n=1 Tax=Danaus plexippus plexippus TaxID=278856 RepID=A0A212FLW7_DANPL|nr:hypothetical protein KGM_215924 [Danaus plexippus plexippus]
MVSKTSVVSVLLVIYLIGSVQMLPTASECRNRSSQPMKTNNANSLLSDVNVEVISLQDILNCPDILTS